MAYNVGRKYLFAVFYPIAEAAVPFVIFALTEATLGAAIPLLSRIPISFVIRGARLNKMIRQVGLLGVKGSGNNIRLVPSNGAPVTKARELFKKLTQDAISVTVENNGVVKANMGNGNTIIFRNFNQSNTGFAASIDIKFPEIWSKVRVLKFHP